MVPGSICVLFSNSAVAVHDSQAYRNMEMTKKRISIIFDPRDILLSKWAVQSLRESLVSSHHLKQLLQDTLSLLQIPASARLPLCLSGCHWHCLVFLALIYILYLVQVLSRLSTRASTSCSSSARASMSSTNRKLVIFLPPMLTLHHILLQHQT